MEHASMAHHEQMMKFIMAKWITKPLYVAAELGIADLLSNGKKTIAELAELTDTNPEPLYRILRALACTGIFTEVEYQVFDITPMAELIKTGALRSTAIAMNAPWNDQAWASLLDGVKTGITPFESTHGMPVTEWLMQHPNNAEELSDANAAKAHRICHGLLNAYDFSDCGTLVDVGGGFGIMLSAILRRNPTMDGILADLAPVLDMARPSLNAPGLKDRIRFVNTDFFNSIPAGGTHYLLSNVLHDWNDEQCLLILKNCYSAMNQGAKLVLIESIIPPDDSFSISKLVDLEMLVITGGKERTQKEYESLISSAGFLTPRIIPIDDSFSIIETSR